MAVKQLEVWDGRRHVATLFAAKRPWDLRCQYSDAVIEAGIANRPLLSCSLPVTRQRQLATPWVRGLLPEGLHLAALATLAGVPTNWYADLLHRYGRDIAGAFSISADPPDETRWSIERYTDDDLATELRTVSDTPGFAMRDDSELSIAGLQNKLLVCAMDDGRWGRPVNGQPSTHIMKLDDNRRPGLVAAEFACLRLAADAGLPAVVAELLDVDGLSVLSVQRYDRALAPDRSIRRLHQEDVCQALAVEIDAHRGRGKYERFGGPSLTQIALLLDRFSEPAVALPQLLAYAVYTWLIGNGDAHGKNLSLLIDTATGKITLAPLYDTVPTALWPDLRPTTAMSVNGKFTGLAGDDFIAEARRWGLGNEAARRAVTGTGAAVQGAIEQCTHAPLAEFVEQRTRDLLSGLE